MKLFTNAAIIALLSISTQIVQANDINIFLGGWSVHYGMDEEVTDTLNSEHSTVGISVGKIRVSTFVNSYFKNCSMVGYEFIARDYGKIRVASNIGLIKGYEDYQMPTSIGNTGLAAFVNVAVQSGPVEVLITDNVVSVGFKLKASDIKKFFR